MDPDGSGSSLYNFLLIAIFASNSLDYSLEGRTLGEYNSLSGRYVMTTGTMYGNDKVQNPAYLFATLDGYTLHGVPIAGEVDYHTDNGDGTSNEHSHTFIGAFPSADLTKPYIIIETSDRLYDNTTQIDISKTYDYNLYLLDLASYSLTFVRSITGNLVLAATDQLRQLAYSNATSALYFDRIVASVPTTYYTTDFFTTGSPASTTCTTMGPMAGGLVCQTGGAGSFAAELSAGTFGTVYSYADSTGIAAPTYYASAYSQTQNLYWGVTNSVNTVYALYITPPFYTSGFLVSSYTTFPGTTSFVPQVDFVMTATQPYPLTSHPGDLVVFNISNGAGTTALGLAYFSYPYFGGSISRRLIEPSSRADSVAGAFDANTGSFSNFLTISGNIYKVGDDLSLTRWDPKHDFTVKLVKH